MVTETPLYEKDYVIIKRDGTFLLHDDGRVVIYNDVMLATEDFKNLPGSKMSSCTHLSSKYRKLLRKNIREFSGK